MSDEATQAAPAGEINVVSAGADAPETFNSPTSAAKYLASLRYKEKDQPAESATESATAAIESEAQADDAAPAETRTPGETQASDAEDDLPPIERPRSWSKDDDDEWRSIPRARQEKIAAKEQVREADINRRINEAAEARKAAEADQARWKQEREQYIGKQTAYTQALETALQNEFGDIQTMDDVRKLQAGDPFRFQAWQLRQMELGQAKAEQTANEQRATQEKHAKRASYEAEQNKLLIEMVPEMADPKKSVEMRERAVSMLTDELGLKLDQLQRWMQDDVGHEILSNAGIQRLIADRMSLKDIKAAVPKAIAKPVPPVQRPGPSAPRGAAQASDLRNLNQRLSESGSVKDAVALLVARRKAS